MHNYTLYHLLVRRCEPRLVFIHEKRAKQLNLDSPTPFLFTPLMYSKQDDNHSVMQVKVGMLAMMDLKYQHYDYRCRLMLRRWYQCLDAHSFFVFDFAQMVQRNDNV